MGVVAGRFVRYTKQSTIIGRRKGSFWSIRDYLNFSSNEYSEYYTYHTFLFIAIYCLFLALFGKGLI